MALTLTRVKEPTVFGNKRVTVLDAKFDASYPTNGEALSVADLQLQVGVDLVLASPASGLIFEYDYTNLKLKAFVQGIDTDAAGAGTLDDFPVTAGVGASTTSVGLTAGDPRFGGLKEVADTTDLSTVTCRLIAIGT